MRRIMVPLILFVVLLLATPIYAVSATTLTENYPTANYDDWIQIDDTHPSAGSVSAAGQSFLNTYTSKLESVKFYLRASGTPNGWLYAQLFAHSGTYGSSSVPTGAALATSAIVACSGLSSAAFNLFTFTFSGANQYILQANTHYCIMIYRTATVDFVYMATDDVGPTHTGNAFMYDTGAWAAINTEDTIFYLYVSNFGSGDGTYKYYIGNPVYENNTDAGTVTVTAAMGSNEVFSLSAAEWYYAPTLPTSFYWDIGGGASRYIFITEAEENFTVTLPDNTDYVYGFTVKDFTGKLGEGQGYLEAYRVIGGVETLVTRMAIYQPNPVAINLVYGATYHLQVLFADGSRYDWGYFMAGGTASITVTLKGVTFTDQAQILYNDIHVEATRPAPYTTITVNYLDDRNNTVWANVTIRIRNGAVVLCAPRTNSSYTLNWASANATLGYVVTVEGEHSEYGVWGRSFILDQTQTFPDPPSLSGIFGDVHPDLISLVIVLCVLLTFSVKFQARGLLAAMAMASLLTGIGWASWTYEWLAFGWLIAVAVALTHGGGE